jgi:hypothetical protein
MSDSTSTLHAAIERKKIHVAAIGVGHDVGTNDFCVNCLKTIDEIYEQENPVICWGESETTNAK